MKRKSKLLLLPLFCCGLVFFTSCEQKKSEAVFGSEEMVEILVNDPDYIEHVKLVHETRKDLLTGKLRPGDIDLEKFLSAMEDFESSEDVLNEIKSNNSPGADRYAENARKKTELILKVIKKYPYLGRVNQAELAEIFFESSKIVSQNLDKGDNQTLIKNYLENGTQKN